MIRGKARRSPAGVMASGTGIKSFYTVVMLLLLAVCLGGVAGATGPERLYAAGFNGSFVPPGYDDGIAPGASPGTAGLYVIDPAEGQLISTVPLDEPGYFLAVKPDALRLFATNGYTRNITVADLTNLSVTAIIALNSSPGGITLSPDSTRLYVALPGEKAIGVLDADTFATLAFIPLDDPPYSLAVSPDGTRLFAISRVNGTVTMIDIPGSRPLSTVAAGTGLSEAVVVRNTLFVTCAGTNSVCVIDLSDNSVKARINGVIAPSYIVYDVAKNALITTSYQDKNVTKIDATGYNVTTTRSFWSSRYGRPAVSADGSLVFATDDTGKIRVINASSLVETGVIDVAWPVTALSYSPSQAAVVEPSPSLTPARPSPGPTAATGSAGTPTPALITPTDILLILLGIAVVLVVLSGITYLMMFRKKE